MHTHGNPQQAPIHCGNWFPLMCNQEASYPLTWRNKIRNPSPSLQALPDHSPPPTANLFVKFSFSKNAFPFGVPEAGTNQERWIFGNNLKDSMSLRLPLLLTFKACGPLKLIHFPHVPEQQVVGNHRGCWHSWVFQPPGPGREGVGTASPRP